MINEAVQKCRDGKAVVIWQVCPDGEQFPRWRVENDGRGVSFVRVDNFKVIGRAKVVEAIESAEAVGNQFAVHAA